MSRRRTSSPQRQRATDAALQRKVGSSSGGGLSGTTLVVVGIGALVIVGLTAILVFSLLAPGASEVVGTPQAMDGRTHITEGTAGGPYSSTPAASGPHWPQPIEWGVYTTAIPQEPAIHNLEHGGIVIWYQADQLSPGEITELEDYVRDWNASERYKVLVAPWGGSDFGHPMAILAWTWLLDLDEVDTELMDRFIDQHYGDGPEPGGGPGPPAVP
ncbi:MAG TPA: DUF3105 domain-containing protein [Candidatus Limnocylindria bacterium]|jgi:hypothetical protein